MKKQLFFYTLFLLALLGPGVSRAHARYVRIVTGHHASPRPHQGYFVTAANDTLRGTLQFNWHGFKQVVALKRQGLRDTAYAFSNIRYVRMQGSDTTLTTLPYTEFEWLAHDNMLCRKIYQDANHAYYDYEQLVNEEPGYWGSTLFIVSGTQHVNLNPFVSLRYSLVRYLNRTYHQHYAPSAFSSPLAVLQFITSHY